MRAGLIWGGDGRQEPADSGFEGAREKLFDHLSEAAVGLRSGGAFGGGLDFGFGIAHGKKEPP